jgi:hypothetical protein
MGAHKFTLPGDQPKSVSADTSGEPFANSRRIFREVQRALVEVGEGQVMPRSARRDVWGALERARAPITAAQAKRLQLQVTDRPLTVCFGRRVRRIPEMRQFVDTDVAHAPFGDGCGVVFADSTSSRRPVFSRYCPGCRKKPGGRRRAEILARCIAACEGRFLLPGGWRLSCSACGERFFAPTPQRRRCDHCRH